MEYSLTVYFICKGILQDKIFKIKSCCKDFEIDHKMYVPIAEEPRVFKPFSMTKIANHAVS